MKWLIKIVDWIEKETWWRLYYKRVTLDEEETLGGRCLQCHAATGEHRCDASKGCGCPCKENQCLKFK